MNPLSACLPRRLALLLAGLLTCLLPTHGHAQAGSLDVSFNPGTGVNAGSAVYSAAVQSDGKIVLGGDFTSINGVTRNHIARLNTDGSLDTSFNPGLGVGGVMGASTQSVALQGDGKIVLGGFFYAVNGVARSGVARLNADGSLDTTFNPGAGVPDNSEVLSVAVQGDGKIVLGGNFGSFNGNGVTRNRVVRLNADGSVDAGFNTGSGANSDVSAVAIQGDGKIVLAGFFGTFNGVAASTRIVRLNADGSVDFTFHLGTSFENAIHSIAVQTDGKVVVGGGGYTTFNGVASYDIARLNADGSLDGGFNPGTGVDSDPAGLSVAVQADGKIIIGGSFGSVNGIARNFVARLNADGSLDSNFNPGTGANNNIRSVAVQADGKIVLGGNFSAFNGVARNGIARLNGDPAPPADPGAVSATFDPKGGTDSTVRAIVFQPDGRVLIGGAFTSYQGSPRNGVARVLADGSLDASFAIGTGADDTVNALLLQGDGKVIVGGDFSSFNGVPRNGVVRLNADGSVDASFDAGLDPGGLPPVGRASHPWMPAAVPKRMARGKGTNQPGFVTALALSPAGKVTLGGSFQTSRGQAAPALTRVTPTGAADPEFDHSAGAPAGRVRALSVSPAQKIVVGGLFDKTGAVDRRNVARLNADGTPDMTFDPGRGAEGGEVDALLVQEDGAVVLGGAFVRAGDQPRAGLARLTADGGLDANFDPGAGADGAVLALAPAPNGGVLVGGDFQSLDGRPVGSLARVQANGRPDPAFNAGAGGGGADARVAAIAVSPTSRQALVGGDFSKVGNSNRSKLALIDNSAPAVPPFFDGAADVGGGFSYLPSFGYFKLLPDNPGYVFHNDLGFLFYIDAKDGKGGAYFYDFATTAGAKSLGFFYTSPSFPFPYLYSFELNAFLYYFPDTRRGAGFYLSAPRVFVRLDTGEFLFR